jgi:polar amino acid transport system substrate-binding protein
MRRPFFASFVVLFLLAVLAFVPDAVAQESSVLSRIVDSGQLRVGTSGSQPPFSVKSKDGAVIGYEMDIATLLAAAMEVELVVVEKPFAELLPALKAGDVDVVMSGMTMTPERNLQAAFVGPYMVSGKSILTKSRTLAAADEAEDIDRANMKVVALKGSTSQKFVERLLPSVSLTTTKNYDEAVAMVLDDRADALVADYPICALSLLRHPDAGLVTLEEPLTIEPIGMAVPPGDSLLLNMIENYLAALEGVGVLEELRVKWFDDGSWLIQVP